MASPRPSQPRAVRRATLALVVVLAVAAFTVVMPLVHERHAGRRCSLRRSRPSTSAETLSYLLGVRRDPARFAVLAARRLGRRDRTPAARATRSTRCTGVLAAALAGALVAVKASAGALGGDDGVNVVLARRLVWWARRGRRSPRADPRPRPWPRAPGAGARVPRGAWARPPPHWLVALLCFAVPAARSACSASCSRSSPPPRRSRWRVRIARLPRRWGARSTRRARRPAPASCPTSLIFRPEEARRRPRRIALETGDHPVPPQLPARPGERGARTATRCSSTRRRSTASASIYLLAAWFQLAPIGYGTLGLLDRGADRALVRAGYGVLRMAGTPRLLAAAAIGVARRRARLQPHLPVGALPQSGPLRFGMPMAADPRGGRRRALPRRRARRAHRGGARSSGSPASGRSRRSPTRRPCSRRWRASRGLALPPRRAAARGSAHAVPDASLAASSRTRSSPLATLAVTGQLPDWGAVPRLPARVPDRAGRRPHLRRRRAGRRASRSAPPTSRRRPRSPSSRAARGALVERERPALVALAGTTAYGIALFSYFVDRSLDHILPATSRCRAARRRRSGSALLLRSGRRSAARRGLAGWRSRSRSPCSSSRSPGPRSDRASRARRSPTRRRAASRCAGRSTGSGTRRRWRPRAPDGERGCSTATCPGERRAS